jgi:non-canonical poly(A) RNA polymerase PAPD5/7
VVKVAIHGAMLCGQCDKIINVDITFDAMAESMNAGILSLNFTNQLLYVYPCLRSLVIVVKSLLARNQLNNSYYGGLSSYSLVIWAVAYLNSLTDPTYDKRSLGDLLRGFVKLYGGEFDASSLLIDIRNYGSFYEMESALASVVSNVLTTDPCDPTNNTTRTLYNFNKVKTLFQAFEEQIQ